MNNGWAVFLMLAIFIFIFLPIVWHFAKHLLSIEQGINIDNMLSKISSLELLVEQLSTRLETLEAPQALFGTFQEDAHKILKEVNEQLSRKTKAKQPFSPNEIKEVKRLIQQSKELETIYQHLKDYGLISIPNVWYAAPPIQDKFVRHRVYTYWIPRTTFYKIEQRATEVVFTLTEEELSLDVLFKQDSFYKAACDIKSGFNPAKHKIKTINPGLLKLDEHGHWAIIKKMEIQY